MTLKMNFHYKKNRLLKKFNAINNNKNIYPKSPAIICLVVSFLFGQLFLAHNVVNNIPAKIVILNINTM